jgi:hypothetical protein
MKMVAPRQTKPARRSGAYFPRLTGKLQRVDAGLLPPGRARYPTRCSSRRRIRAERNHECVPGPTAEDGGCMKRRNRRRASVRRSAAAPEPQDEIQPSAARCKIVLRISAFSSRAYGKVLPKLLIGASIGVRDRANIKRIARPEPSPGAIGAAVSNKSSAWPRASHHN